MLQGKFYLKEPSSEAFRKTLFWNTSNKNCSLSLEFKESLSFFILLFTYDILFDRNEMCSFYTMRVIFRLQCNSSQYEPELILKTH